MNNLNGKIIKGVGGLYFVQTANGVYACKARGLFRLHKQTPLVGDRVEISVVDEEKSEGWLLELNERKNELIRPRVANVDINVIVVSAAKPKLSFELLDSLLIYSETQNLEAAVCVNKTDVAPPGDVKEIARVYGLAGYRVICASAVSGVGVGELTEYINGKSVILSGPSGTGKTSLLNAVMPGLNYAVGELSKKTRRGKHTTRHAEFLRLNNTTFICDTPGFTSFSLNMLDNRDLRNHYPEFRLLDENCYYNNCLHISEHDCAVKEQVGKAIDEGRYNRYCKFVQVERR